MAQGDGGKARGAVGPSASASASAPRSSLAFVRTLLWKNWTLKRRHPVATFFELALPCIYILVMGQLKGLVDDVDVPAGWSDDGDASEDGSGSGSADGVTQGVSYNLYSTWGSGTPRFVYGETTLWGLMLFMGAQSIAHGIRMDELTQAALDACQQGVVRDGMVDTDTSSPYRVPEACEGKVAPYKIAITPDTAFTRDYFLKTMDSWYPRIDILNSTVQIPSLRESVVFYDTEDALAEYVKSNEYGSGLDNPRIFAGIVFDTFPQEVSEIGSFQTIEYTLRLNSTRSRGGFLVGNIPRTYGDPPQLDPFEKSIVRTYYPRYAATGFMTLQTLVTRFVNCMPVWDADAQSTNGTCQGAQSSVVSNSSLSSELDDRLLESLENDVLIQRMLRTISNGSDIQMADMIPFLSTETREALLTPLRQAPQPYLGSTVAPFPIERYTSSPFYEQVSNVFAIVFILSYLYSISRILLLLIQEKELRLREFMKILGVRESAIITSWYITYTIILFIGAVLQAAAGQAGLFATSSITVVFVFFFLFGLSVLAYGFLISAFFSRSRLGAFVGVVLFFLMYFVSAAFTADSSESSQNAGCLLSPVALALGVNVFANLESTRTGVSWDNISMLSDNFRLSTALWMFAIDTIIYTVLGLYFEKVIPKEHGTTLKWYFPVSPSYWRVQFNPAKMSDTSSSGSNSDDHGEMSPSPAASGRVDDALLDNVVLDVNPNFEPVSNELREQERRDEVLSLQRLRKVFSVPGGERVAVNGVSLAMYKNQITCLLGHNGAGKTTLISMLTGMTAPTSGNATFRGLSITRDMEKLRESLGICFQHDVLFSEMTVEEHLRFFGRIKGFRGDDLRAIIDTQIREVGLTEKRHVKSNELSGGMKRKLSVAVSLLGDSSLVFLDEPTSGMDPYSRRSTWEILLNNRNGRVMVLTTHFMDEADILGDRIAIMAEGELRCCGSSLFLKNRYGAGYTLTLVKNNAASTSSDSELMAFIVSHVPNALVLSNVGSEIAFQLPLASSPQFAAMFSELDNRLSSFGLLSYGVSVTTLEEVFIKVAEAADENQQHTLDKGPQPDWTPNETAQDGNESASNSGETTSVIPQRSFFGTHLQALILKRFRVAKRDKKAIIYSTALPIFLLLIGLGILRSANFTDDDPNLPLTTDAYAKGANSPTPFFCQPSATSGDSSALWCESVLLEHYTGAEPQEVSLPQPAYNSSSPTVFGVTYTDPTINASDATGYEVRLGEEIYTRGYIGDDESGPVEGQYGAYLVYGERERNLFGYNVFINTSSTHAPAVFKALLDQALYRFFAANVSGSDDSMTEAPTVNLIVNNHPLPLTASTQALFGSFLAFTACLFICIAFTFFPASIVVFLVKEKQAEHNSKHQQLVSGVSLGAFWLSNFVFDFLVYLVPCICGLALIQIFDISSMTGSDDCVTCTSATFPAVIVLFLTFGLAVCPFNYCLSYLFKEHASSQSYTIIINFIIGVVLMVVSFMLDVIEETQAANSVLVFFWRLSPLFNLGYGLMNLVLNELEGVLTSSGEKTSPFSPDIMGFEIIYLVFTAVLYGALAVGIDYALTFPKIKHWLTGSVDVEDEPFEEDVDVVTEAERVAKAGGSVTGEIVTLSGLRKVYKGGKVAVRDLSFGLQRGECFGFLGINGAGKTTTLKMLTGDVLPTRGAATLNGFDILSQQMEVRRQIGYCPQFDALFELLTVREHLELFASIKGVSRGSEALDRVVDDKIRQLNLGDFEHKLAGSLSGGNKRKLSVAIAMIGDPRILFLDEPSTGMDPVSRRFMWDVISDVSTRGRSSTVVLTTHSMEEAEALCSRVGIMVGGRLRCLGNIQHLKSRFGDGLVVDVKLRTPAAHEVDDLIAKHGAGSDSKAPGVDARDERVLASDLEDRCRAFGNVALAQRIVKTHPTGYSLAAALERDGSVRAAAFWSWCVEEARFDALHAYLQQSFGGDRTDGAGVTVMERQNDFCRFKVRGGERDTLRLSQVFARIEESKAEMHVREYSVSQTTLEQIFNFFAAQQQEERGVARGVYQDAAQL